MSEQDKEWLRLCIDFPEAYKIVVDNDGQWVEHNEESVYDLCPFVYGDKFAIELLKFMGCNAESV